MWYNGLMKNKRENIERVDFLANIFSYGDDSKKALEKSYKAAKRLTELGFSKIVIAPKFVPKRLADKKAIEREVLDFQWRIKGLNTTLKFDGSRAKTYLASEIFLYKNIDQLVFERQVAVLENEYLLIKLPERGAISLKKVESVLVELRKKGYVPVLAGVEKAEFLYDDFSQINKLSGSGAMFLCLYSSIIGENGKNAAKLMEYVLEQGFCDFLGTGVKDEKDPIFRKFDKAEMKIIKIVGKTGYKKIMRNALGVLY